ncbi:MAG: hypothetical protein NVSMB17_03170 [Candidatus Dormibacteria bacterium]
MAAALVTDSASGLTREACARLGIGLVELRVVVGGQDRADPDVRARDLVPHLNATGQLSTSQPPPAAFTAAYARAASAGATLIWSIHPAAAFSGTADAARLAAKDSPVEVRVIDSGTISMAQGLCALRALAALHDDPAADVDRVVREEMATQESVFVSLTPALLARSGRAGSVGLTDSFPVLSIKAGTGMTILGQATGMDDAVELMSGHVAGAQRRQTLAVGDGCARSWGDRLAEALDGLGSGSSLVRYEVPASVTAQAGPTVGVVISAAALPGWLLTAMAPGRPATPSVPTSVPGGQRTR